MSRNRAFTLTELCTSCVLAVLVFGVTQAIIGCDGEGATTAAPVVNARKTARQMQSSTQVRGIVQGLIVFSPGNYDRYPGFDSKGNEDKTALPPSGTHYGVVGKTGFDPAWRYAILLRNNYFTPEWAVSPGEVNTKIEPASLRSSSPGQVTAANYSYAMLELASGKGRNVEWMDTTNSKAVVVSDRNLGTNTTNAKSIFSDGGAWRGSVGYNDNHVTFETTHILADTQYGHTNPSVKSDNLFQSGDALEGPSNVSEPDALMTFKSPNDGGANQNP